MTSLQYLTDLSVVFMGPPTVLMDLPACKNHRLIGMDLTKPQCLISIITDSITAEQQVFLIRGVCLYL